MGTLFEVTNSDARAVSFRSDFVQNLPSLLDPNLATFFISITNDAHNNGQSHSQIPGGNDYLNHFAVSRGSSFEAAISSKIAQTGSTLTVDQVLNRATAMTCGGCHQPSTFWYFVGGRRGAWPKLAGISRLCARQ